MRFGGTYINDKILFCDITLKAASPFTYEHIIKNSVIYGCGLV